jgi:dephospho-CoA kinase
MLRVGLTGNRYSGKNTICKLFRQIRVPVFDADIVLKFILNYEYDLLEDIRHITGVEYFHQEESVDINNIDDSKFGEILKIVEPYIFKAYSKFENTHSDSVYTIFHSSVLFESNWSSSMDLNINVHAPFGERLERSCYLNGVKSISDKNIIKNVLRNETSSSIKNNLADIVIHNYDFFDVLDLVNKADSEIVNSYIKSIMTINI